MFRKSRMTAPVGEVTIPTVRGKAGSGFLRAGSKLFEGQLKRTGAYRLHGFSHQLHLSALLVDAYPTPNQNVQTVFGTKPQQHGLTSKKHHGKLRFGVLEREVHMA